MIYLMTKFYCNYIALVKYVFVYLQPNCNKKLTAIIMKKLFFLPLAALLTFSCSSDDDSETSRTPPSIVPAEGRDAIRPTDGEVRSATTSHMHVRFKVTDPDGVRQARVDIHHAFDGHSHGRSANQSDFMHLDYQKIYEGDGRDEINIDDNFEDVYWEGPRAEDLFGGRNVLAGPYDFSVDATDIHGNQTSFTDNTSYLARFWIKRNYAPQIDVDLTNDEIKGTGGQPLSVSGTIERNLGESLSSDITFVWVRLYEEDDHGHGHSHSEDIYDEKWGASAWRSGMSGDALPSSQSISLSDLLSGNKAINLPSGHAHYELLIWVEDDNGNVSQETYKVDVD